MTGSVVLAAKAPARWAAMPAAHRMTPKPLAFAFRANSAASAGVRCADRMCASNGMSSALSWAQAPFTTGQSLSEPMITATLRIIFPSLSFSLSRLRANKKGCDAATPRPFDPTVCAEHARMRLHGCPGIQSHTDGEWFQAAVPAFRIPPNSLRGFPVPSSGTVRSAPHRPSDTYSLRQKIRFAKGVWANSPLCSLAPKNFQKFCAVSTLIFFLSMTYLWNIF